MGWLQNAKRLKFVFLKQNQNSLFSFYFFQSIRLNKNMLIFNQIKFSFFVWKTNTVDLFSEQIFRAPFSGITTKEWTTNSYNTIQIFFGLVCLLSVLRTLKKVRNCHPIILSLYVFLLWPYFSLAIILCFTYAFFWHEFVLCTNRY